MRRKNQQGISLIEVLISVVVLAIGLLGIAALQSNAAKYNHSAQLRSIAIAQANNMIDRMYSNHKGLDAGVYDNISGIPANPGCTLCSASQMAQNDARIWNTNNAQFLPSGQGTVTRNGDRWLVTMRWDGNRSGASGTGCSGNTDIDLSCLILEIKL